MAGTLLLDFDTILTAPRFFSLLSLVERAAGRRIVVIDADPSRKDGERLIAGYGIPLHQYVRVGYLGDAADEYTKARQNAKLKEARNKGPPVIWVDLEFGDWKGQPLAGIPGIVTLNWNEALKMGSAREVGNA